MMMKRIGVLLLLVCICGAAETAKKRSIMDYYLAMPENYFFCEDTPKKITAEWRKKQICLADVPNGYMRACYDKSSEFELALFRDKVHNRDLVIINRTLWGSGGMCNELGCYTIDSSGKWKQTNDFSYPDIYEQTARKSEGGCIILLPRTGTDITVADDEGKTVYMVFQWKNGTFIKK